MENVMVMGDTQLLNRIDELEESLQSIQSELREKYFEIVNLRDVIYLLEMKNLKIFKALEIISDTDNYHDDYIINGINMHPDEYAISIIREMEFME